MNTREQFVDYLKANGIDFEEIDNNVLFDFEGHNLVAKGLGTVKKKDFSIGIPFVAKADEMPTNSDKELIRKYLRGEDGISGGIFAESVENNPDYTISVDNIIKVSEGVASKNYEEEVEKLAEVASAVFGAFKDMSKAALSAGAEMLRGIADAIAPKDSK